MRIALFPRRRPMLLAAVIGVLALVPAPRWAADDGAALKEFEVVAERFSFTPERIEVDEGDRVRVTVRSIDGTHGWAIDELDIDLYVHKSGRPETAEFVAERAGTFEIKCSEYCGRGHSRMKGVLVVNPGGRR